MTRPLPILLLLATIAACGGSRLAPAGAAPGGESAQATVVEFMRAVADSNLVRMAQLWGTQRGSAAETRNPPDYERRIIVIHSYLRNGGHRVIGEIEGGNGRRIITLELTRPGCTKQVPFTLLRVEGGTWLVNAVDLDAAGHPMKPCG